MTSAASWSIRNFHSSVIDSSNYVYIIGGRGTVYNNDMWKSTDYGATWIQMATSAWSIRGEHKSVIDQLGNIYVIGGWVRILLQYHNFTIQ
jgi:hypothetical protein